MPRRQGTNSLGIDQSKTGGHRKRRMARERKQEKRRKNIYDVKTGKVYGLYRDGDKWVLTAKKAGKRVERLKSDRRGAVETETVTTGRCTESGSPKEWVQIGTYDTKSEATNSEYYTPDSWEKITSGVYTGCSEKVARVEVDRDKLGSWFNQGNVVIS